MTAHFSTSRFTAFGAQCQRCGRVFALSDSLALPRIRVAHWLTKLVEALDDVVGWRAALLAGTHPKEAAASFAHDAFRNPWCWAFHPHYH
jgi:hypothetical protein